MEGIGVYTSEITKELVQTNPNVHFHIFYDRTSVLTRIEAPNATEHVISPQARHPLLWWIWFELSLSAKLRKLNIDILFSTDGMLPTRLDIPTVTTCHDIAFEVYPQHYRFLHAKYYKHYFPKFLKVADKIICISNSTKKEVISHYGVSEEKLHVVHNGTSTKFRPLNSDSVKRIREKVSSGCPYFVFVGALHPRKNLVNLVKGFELFRQKSTIDVKMVLYGRFAWKSASIKRQIKKSECKEHIIQMHSQEVSVEEAMASSLALTYVSHYEGFGLPIVEAMQSGVPVIAAGIDSLEEVAGDAAIMVDPNSPQEIASAMLQVSTQADLRENLIDKGLAQAKHFSWKRSADETMGLLMNEIKKSKKT